MHNLTSNINLFVREYPGRHPPPPPQEFASSSQRHTQSLMITVFVCFEHGLKNIKLELANLQCHTTLAQCMHIGSDLGY